MWNFLASAPTVPDIIYRAEINHPLIYDIRFIPLRTFCSDRMGRTFITMRAVGRWPLEEQFTKFTAQKEMFAEAVAYLFAGANSTPATDLRRSPEVHGYASAELRAAAKYGAGLELEFQDLTDPEQDRSETSVAVITGYHA